MKLKINQPLDEYTSLAVGGTAENFVEPANTDELIELLASNHVHPVWILGYGCNTLISDSGLPGLVIRLHGGEIKFKDDSVIVDAGVWWDDVVLESMSRGLWGIELMSEVPGSVGGALYINITAYGQSIGPLVEWIDIWDDKTKQVRRLDKNDLSWGYKSSIFQTDPVYKNSVILRTSIKLSPTKTDELTYQKAVDIAEELNVDPNTLEGRREIIHEARARAGSLWNPKDKSSRTAGSFFRNPMVKKEQIDAIIAFDESGKTAEQVKKMNQTHGGSEQRVSAAHVLLASGFHRGQQWGNVKLNDKNLLKIETLPGATASDVYKVVKLLQKTCHDKLGIHLEPEAQMLGYFSANE